MISFNLARRLQEVGLAWKPSPGDRFTIPDRGLDETVFVLSDMTIEVHDLPEGPIIGFNGTTEWALDDVEKEEAVWLPREDQLRDLLGGTFRTLTREDGGYRVATTRGEYRAAEPAEAYALALLELLRAALD
jgi:hypothetical protein